MIKLVLLLSEATIKCDINQEDLLSLNISNLCICNLCILCIFGNKAAKEKKQEISSTWRFKY